MSTRPSATAFSRHGLMNSLSRSPERSKSAVAEDRGPFLLEGSDAFLVVVRVVGLAAEGLDTLVGFGRERVGVREDAQFLLEDAVDQRRSGDDRRGHRR